MPFDLNKFNEIFGFDKFELSHMMTQFQASAEDSTDEFEVYRAIIATHEFNSNYLFLDEKTMQNIARASNRDTAGNDIPIFPNHNRYDFQIGTMLTGKYMKSKKRVEGTFNIIKDTETKILRNRINNGVVRDVSPTIQGEAECDVCGDGTKMWRYGGCKNGHYLGEVISIDGKERIVTGTFKNAKLVEVSVVSMGAFPGATIFSENEEMLREALMEGVISEKALDLIEYNYSVDLSASRRTTVPVPTPQPQPQGDPSMSKPTPLEATPENISLLQNQVQDANAKVTQRDQQIASFQEEKKGLVPKSELEEVQNKLTEANQSIIQKDAEIDKSSDYQACLAHVQKRAVEFYAKIRGVDVDNETDELFVSRKNSIMACTSLSYLLSSENQYVDDYYSETTEFGGLTQREARETTEAAPVRVNPNNFDI